jgi:hypothetical protein
MIVQSRLKKNKVWLHHIGHTYTSTCPCGTRVNVWNFEVRADGGSFTDMLVLCRNCTGKTSGRKSERQKVWEREFGMSFKGQCPIFGCKKRLTPFTFEKCHIISRAKGGEDELDNYRAGCSSCNRAMGTRNWYEYDYEMRELNGDDDEVYNIECILDQKDDMFLVHWEGHPDSANSWIHKSQLEGESSVWR